MQKNKFHIFLLLAAVLVFCLMTVNLFMLRFKIGDIYPPYSSFRTDPLGTRALYEALTDLGLLAVERHFKPVEEITHPASTCLITAGAPSSGQLFIMQKKYKTVQDMVNKGLRVVIALRPVVHSKSYPPGKKDNIKTEKPEKKEKKPVKDEFKPVDFYKEMGVTLKRTGIKEKGQYAVPSTLISAEYNARPVPWQQAFWFELNAGGWKTIYSIGSSEPVIIEKEVGAGSIVLLADSYILSNESLKKNPVSPVLAWLIGGKQAILFNEYHLGVRAKTGISTLMKKYRLYGPALFASIFVILLVWKLSARLLPPDDDDGMESEPGSRPEQIPASGLTSLLKQHIPKKELIPRCMDAWKASFVSEHQASTAYAGKYEKMKTAISSTAGKFRSKQIAADYIRICHILSEKENQ